MPKGTNRRNFLGKAIAGAAGVGAACSLEERILMAALDQKEKEGTSDDDQAAGDDKSRTVTDYPCGKIGDLKMSRLLMGGNLIGGWSHARDLIYVSRLFKEYNTEAKIFETLALGEQQGIDTIQIDPKCQDVVESYKRRHRSKLQTMVCMRPDKDVAKMAKEVKQLVDKGATTLYTHGHFTDKCTQNGDADTLGKALDLIKKEGLKAGIGGHSLKNIVLSEEQTLDPDYYVKTMHDDRYWSATPKEHRKEFCWHMGQDAKDHDGYFDNIYCLNPEETAAYMKNVTKPWVAFKVLAAGAIHPKFGFSFAVRNGADFIIVGMFDFHVKENAKLAADVFAKNRNRKARAWYA